MVAYDFVFSAILPDMKKYITFAILAFVLLGAACQKKTPVTTTASNSNTVTANTNTSANTAVASVINPCSLLTQGEAASAFGKTAAVPAMKGNACRYDTADASKFFDLTAKSGIDADFETMKNLCDSPAQPVTGLGATSCTANNTVVLLKNDVLMTLIAGGVFDQDQLRGLAVTAAGRIP